MDACLSLDALAEVQRYLTQIEHRWYDIGLQLGLDPTRLEGIRVSGQTNGERLVSMIQLWLKSLKASWRRLCTTLEGPVVQEPATASKIRQDKGENCVQKHDSQCMQLLYIRF